MIVHWLSRRHEKSWSLDYLALTQMIHLGPRLERKLPHQLYWPHLS